MELVKRIDEKRGRILNYKTLGNGPAVMLVHGLCEDFSIWEDTAVKLSESYRVICPNLMGFGGVAAPVDGDFSLESYAEDLERMLSFEGYSTMVLIGHSMGGYIGLSLAEKSPHLLKGLMLYHSTTSGDSPDRRDSRTRSIRVLEKNRNLFFREVFRNLFANHRQSEFENEIRSMTDASGNIDTTTVTGVLEVLRDRPERTSVLRQIPVHFLIGRHDNVLPAEQLITEAESAGCGYTVLEDSGHMGFYESPEEAIECIRQFLREAEFNGRI